MIDQIGQQILLDQQKPLRIVSLVPSQTELLYDLGLDEEVVGITKFCIHPDAWFRQKARIGGTKKVHFDKIKALEPTLIIANKEENTEADVLALRSICPVYCSDIANIDDAMRMITDLGELCDQQQNAAALNTEIAALLQKLPKSAPPKRALYGIWYNPWMFAGADTFITQMMKYAGYTNICNHNRYPTMTSYDIVDFNPDYVLLSSEPFPFKEKHIAEMQALLPKATIKLVDGELYSWYGSRILSALRAFIAEN